MGLSIKQLQQIADGYAVFKRLLDPVLMKTRQLQLQQPGSGNSRSSSSINQGHGTQCCGNAVVDGGADLIGVCSSTGTAAAAAAASNTLAMLSVEGYAVHR
jgi:hypothetical protein